uniref:Uncharacterized protein n=1 Tax=Arundo donax TaxID=35708 RepID=A0A0A9ELP9_ARUDO
MHDTNTRNSFTTFGKSAFKHTTESLTFFNTSSKSLALPPQLKSTEARILRATASKRSIICALTHSSNVATQNPCTRSGFKVEDSATRKKVHRLIAFTRSVRYFPLTSSARIRSHGSSCSTRQRTRS